jgi:chorismate--pyruvate lyase
LYAPTPTAGQPTEPRWTPARRLPARALGATERAWLLDEGSLTARLVRASGGRFAVRLLSRRWQRPLPSERRALGLHAGGHALVREVLLECDGVPWVFARSVMPATSLRAELRHLRRFGARSLGALLFSDPRITRGPFELARVAPAHGLLPATLDVGCAVWARRRCFALRGRALLVQEMFLPASGIGSL